jgi:medium-chain acyl-[acyl-carrier-protein] hydrolase
MITMNSRERFETMFPVASYEADLNGNLSLFALFNHFQDLAGEHAAFLEVGYEELRSMKLTWILSRIKVQVRSLPAWGDTVQLATWPKGVDRLFALRDFSLTSEKGETLVLATTAWLLVDVEKNRPQRIDVIPVDLRFPGASHAIREVPDKIALPQHLTPIFEKPIWISDLDTNQHVNNAQYAKWIGDCFSEDHYRHRRLTSMHINYLEEALLGDTIELLKTPEDGSAGEYFVGGMSKTKGSMAFHARLTWD